MINYWSALLLTGQTELSDLHSLCIETTPPNPKILNFNPPTSSNLLVASSMTWRFLTSYSFVLNFSKTRISSINPQIVKTGTGNVIAPDNKCGNWDSGKWIELLSSAVIKACRPADWGMLRSCFRVPSAMSGEYWSRCRRILIVSFLLFTRDLLVAHSFQTVCCEETEISSMNDSGGIMFSN